MPRLIYTESFPQITGEIPKDAIVVTPHHSVADRFGVPFRTLRSIAKDILKKERIGIASPLTALHALKYAIREVSRDRDKSAEASRIREILGTVLRSGIDIDKLWRHGSPRVRTFARIALIYTEKLWESRMIDSEAVLSRAGQLELEPQKLFIFGYFRARPPKARPEEIEFIDRLADDGSMYYLPCSGDSIFSVNREWVDRLVRSGWEIAPAETAIEPNRTAGEYLAGRFAQGKQDGTEDIDSYAARSVLPFHAASGDTISNAAALLYPGIEAEIRGTLASAKNLIIAGTPPGKIAIVCRNENTYAPLIASVSREFSMPVEMTHEIALKETAIGNFLTLLFDAKLAGNGQILTDFDYETTVRMLRQRYGPGIAAEKWPEIRKSHTHGFELWCGRIEQVKILATPDEQPLAYWLVWLKKVLSEFGVRSTAAQSAAEMTALNRFTDSLDELAGFDDGRERTFDGFATSVYEILSDVKTPFDPALGGIRLHQPNTIAGCEFEHVFVAGMAEGMLPEAVIENTVVDFYERKQLAEHGIHFEDAGEVPRWETLSFYFVLLAAAKSVTLSYPRYVDGEERLPSAFFERLGLKPVEAETEFASSIEEHRRAFLTTGTAPSSDEVFAAAKRQFDIENRRESGAPFDEYDGVIGISFDPARRTWSASSLTKIGSCPFKWFADKALRLGVPEEAETDLPPNTKGSLYHKTLEIAVRNSIEAAEIRAAVLENLEAAFAEAESSGEFSLELVDNWDLRRSEHLEALRNAVCSAAFIGDSSRVLAVEQEFKAEWHGLKLTGKIDRIDETPEGLTAVDYKTGSYTGKVKDESGKLRIDLQLPIYSQAALPKLYPGKPVGPGIYLRLAKGEAEQEKVVELDWFVKNVKVILNEGRFAVDPDADENACKYCEYDSVCRRGPRLARKRTNNEPHG